MNPFDGFDEIWVADFEFGSEPGARPIPRCLVAREVRSGRLVRQWLDGEPVGSQPPFRIDAGALFVAFFASAELGCFLALGWPMPARILDLFVEYRKRFNGLETPGGWGLLGAAAAYGLDTMDATEKDTMRVLALRGGPYTADERRALLAYCQADVDLTAKLVVRMAADLDLPRALLRGRYMAAVARMEWRGVPIDAESLGRLRRHWEPIKSRLIERIDKDYGIYDGLTFKADRFAMAAARQGIVWPRLGSGALDLSDDAFREMAKLHRWAAPLRELRHTQGQLRLIELAVGPDGRNRCLLSPFRSKTGRNQPSNSKFIFGPSCWLRSLIKPEPGRALAYLDYKQQEFGIAAALSGDPAMRRAYQSADPYLTFAIQAGAVPADATKETHRAERDRFKTCALGVLFGLAEKSLGSKIGQTSVHGRELLRLHKQTYPTFWRWSQSAVDHAMLFGRLWTVYGWEIRTPRDPNPNSLKNFPMQANGAEILRLACSMLTESGIDVCCPVHDAVLIEADADVIDAAVERARGIMEEASRIVRDGFTVGTDANVIRWPDRYADERGATMWWTVWEIVAELERDAG